MSQGNGSGQGREPAGELTKLKELAKLLHSYKEDAELSYRDLARAFAQRSPHVFLDNVTPGRSTIQERLAGKPKLLADPQFIKALIHECTPDDPHLQATRLQHALALREEAIAQMKAPAAAQDLKDETILQQAQVIADLTRQHGEINETLRYLRWASTGASQLSLLLTFGITMLEADLTTHRATCRRLRQTGAPAQEIEAAELRLRQLYHQLARLSEARDGVERHYGHTQDVADRAEARQDEILAQLTADQAADLARADDDDSAPLPVLQLGEDQARLIRDDPDPLLEEVRAFTTDVVQLQWRVHRQLNQPALQEQIEPDPIDPAPGSAIVVRPHGTLEPHQAEEVLDAEFVEDQAPSPGADVTGAPAANLPVTPTPTPSWAKKLMWGMVGAGILYAVTRPCPNCQNTRTVRCNTCPGTGNVRTPAVCPGCNGRRTQDGTTLCRLCHGEAEIQVSIDCRTCRGTGTVRCPLCTT